MPQALPRPILHRCAHTCTHQLTYSHTGGTHAHLLRHTWNHKYRHSQRPIFIGIWTHGHKHTHTHTLRHSCTWLFTCMPAYSYLNAHTGHIYTNWHTQNTKLHASFLWADSSSWHPSQEATSGPELERGQHWVPGLFGEQDLCLR